jgi:vacuolar-type H+-ATPase subunit F/Vma7
MTAVVAIGEAHRLAGFALAGVDVRDAGDEQSVREAWNALGSDVGLLILTPQAEGVLGPRLSERKDVVWVSLPE